MRFLTAALLLMTTGLAGQASGSTVATVTGVLLGGGSMTLLGATGALAPCALTRRPATCARNVAVFSGLAGATAGGLLGARDADGVSGRYTSAGWGAAAGAVVGLALLPLAQEWNLQDAAALTAVGGAVGSAPLGSAIGLTAGLGLGALLQGIDDDGTPFGTLAFGLAGLTVGALAEWSVRAVANHRRPVTLTVRLTLP